MSGASHIWRRVWSLVGLGKVVLADDSGRVLRAQVTVGDFEIKDNCPILQQFGLASVPPAGTDVVLSSVGGDRSNGVVVATNDQASRPTGKLAGETMLFNAFGMSVYLSATGITISAANQLVTVTAARHVTLDTPEVDTTGNLRVGTGATGSFTTTSGSTVTVQNGIITSIH